MLIAFTGAGISKASGIATFEDQGDIRDCLTRQFATNNPNKFKSIVKSMKQTCDSAKPNDAHIVLAEYNIPIITMNVDRIHSRAGSKNILPIHGELPNIVLYGDAAPLYTKANSWIRLLGKGDILLIVGVSFYTGISIKLKQLAKTLGSDVEIINDNAETRVREFIELNIDKIETFEELRARNIKQNNR